MRSVRHDDERPVVVCLHASASTGAQWCSLARRLEGRYRVITPDLVGYPRGPTAPIGDRLTIADQLAWIATKLEFFEAPFHLVGHGYGGLLALEVAAGTLLLGNAGACFECGHEHGQGDRCLAVHVGEDLFDEVVASAAGSRRFRFKAAMLPAMPELLPTLVGLETLNKSARPLAAESLVIRLIERVGETMSGHRMTGTKPARGDERRMSAVLRHIETNIEEQLDLDALAAHANMSKYHFLRTFRRATGQTPYKYILALRMRRAALKLATTEASVATIAYDTGFGDLSTFNHRFRDVFGATPTKFRAKAA